MIARDEYIEKLAKVAKMTPDEARKALLDEVQADLTGEIAKKIREKDGGLQGVKALGFEVDGLAQVSMNLVDYEKTNFDKAYHVVEAEAEKRASFGSIAANSKDRSSRVQFCQAEVARRSRATTTCWRSKRG